MPLRQLVLGKALARWPHMHLADTCAQVQWLQWQVQCFHEASDSLCLLREGVHLHPTRSRFSQNPFPVRAGAW